MRASRLLSIIMRLQQGQVTAEQLSETLEVSIRTIYRDMDHLSLAGVPVYADRGRSGGFQLLEGWKMPPTGLTGIEIEALLLSGMPDQVKQLGLQTSMLSGQTKLLETLPETQRAAIGKISAYVYVDPVSWFGAEEPAEKLHDIADAVWNSQKITCVYESWKGSVQRMINPLGLVVKGGRWYLAGEVEGDERIYRVGKFQELKVLKDTFSRPVNFDLPNFWRQAVKRYETAIYSETATLRVNKAGLENLHELGTPVAEAANASLSGPDTQGFYLVSIPIETIERASADIMRLGPDCQALEPPELVVHIQQKLHDMIKLYSS
ncbi:hypothetical protein A9Q83_15970 [Alphaproteobacteria bacterium 46_93_T64]|nr:hypothetical protein A9Q83_15970 [Alphaproteobacteria bacterium 46_93_T64]